MFFHNWHQCFSTEEGSFQPTRHWAMSAERGVVRWGKNRCVVDILEVVATDNAEHLQNIEKPSHRVFPDIQYLPRCSRKMLSHIVFSTPHPDTGNTVSEYKNNIYSHINQSISFFQDSIWLWICMWGQWWQTHMRCGGRLGLTKSQGL